MFEHDLRLVHRRHQLDATLGGRAPADSEPEVDARSTDLVEAVHELLSRLPSDLYEAIKAVVVGGPVGSDAQ